MTMKEENLCFFKTGVTFSPFVATISKFRQFMFTQSKVPKVTHETFERFCSHGGAPQSPRHRLYAFTGI